MFELGIEVEEGSICFRSTLFNKDELMDRDTVFKYYNPEGEANEIELKPGQFGFTLIQVPVIYEFGDADRIILIYENGDQQEIQGNCLSQNISGKIFSRNGEIMRIVCSFSN
jgi:hypothetical protein